MIQQNAILIESDDRPAEALVSRRQPLMVMLVLLEWLFASLEKFDDFSLRAQMKLEDTL